MPLETIYDIQLDGCRYGFVPLIFAFLAVSSAVAWYGRRYWVRPDGQSAVGFHPVVGCVFFGVLAILGFITTWGDYFHLLRVIEAHHVDIVEGTVSNFHAAATIKSTESFEVAGQTFSYSKYAAKQGFNTLSREGSPLANGKTVRVHFVQGQIVKLEFAR